MCVINFAPIHTRSHGGVVGGGGPTWWLLQRVGVGVGEIVQTESHIYLLLRRWHAQCLVVVVVAFSSLARIWKDV